MPLSTSCEFYQHDVKRNDFHTLHVIFHESDLWHGVHESDLWHGVTNRHRLTTNSVGLNMSMTKWGSLPTAVELHVWTHLLNQYAPVSIRVMTSSDLSQLRGILSSRPDSSRKRKAFTRDWRLAAAASFWALTRLGWYISMSLQENV